METTRTITSRFPSKCAQCGDPIRVGETITHVPAMHKAFHPACWTNRELPEPAKQQAVKQVHHTSGAAVDYSKLREMLAAMLREASPQIREMAREEVLKAGITTIEVKRPDGATVNVGRQHKTFPLLVQALAAGVHVWLPGPAGSGKTTAAEMAAKALGRPFSFDGALDTEYKVVGFVDAQGRIVSTEFRHAYTKGGVHLFDECDASLPAATLAINAALANGFAAFPDGHVRMHPEFRCIAAANTIGQGATFDYVGRNKMDAAFLDRFVTVAWEYDEAFETHLAGNAEWSAFVQEKRARAKAQGLRVVISPRASIFGARLLAAGLDRETVIRLTLSGKMRPEDWKALS